MSIRGPVGLVALRHAVGPLAHPVITAALDAVEQAMLVAEEEERAASDEAAAARAAREDVTLRMVAVERTFAAQASSVRSSWGALLASLQAAAAPEALADTLSRVAVATGLDDVLPFARDEQFTSFLADPTAELVFAAAPAKPAWNRPPLKALHTALGVIIDAPVDPVRHRRLLDLTSSPDTLHVDPFAGLHLSVERLEGAYRHHAITVGDGTVIHFSGEPTRPLHGTVQRLPVSGFLKRSDPYTLRVHFPHREGDAPVPSFVPNIIALRALSILDVGGYDLLGRNCEHFGTWAQCGAMLSSQADNAWRALQMARSADIHPHLPDIMTEYLAGWTMRLAHERAVLVPPSLGADEDPVPPLFDIGRVLWAHDHQSPVWLIPLWVSADPNRLWDPPFGPHDRPWTLDAQADVSIWHTQPPTIQVARGWHAALLADATGAVFALEQDGTWWKTAVPLADIVTTRTAAIQQVNQALAQRGDVFTPPPVRPADQGGTA